MEYQGRNDGKKRTADFVYVRHLAIYFILDFTDISLKS